MTAVRIFLKIVSVNLSMVGAGGVVGRLAAGSFTDVYGLDLALAVLIVFAGIRLWMFTDRVYPAVSRTRSETTPPKPVANEPLQRFLEPNTTDP